MKPLRLLLGVLFILAGALHFIQPRSYLAMMPPWIPRHDEAVAVSGVAEIVGGAALLSGRTARFGGAWLVAVLVAVFPANIHMALNPDQIRGLDAENPTTRKLLWLRLPLQPLAIWLVWKATRPTA
ncbi:MAG: DoxX family membrane protein [Thermoleophilia bacterium]|nr:DoxX family membrane protein [Thermoleophilia bacterium]